MLPAICKLSICSSNCIRWNGILIQFLRLCGCHNCFFVKLKEVYSWVWKFSFPMYKLLEYVLFLFTLTLVCYFRVMARNYLGLQQTNLISSLQAFVNASHFWPNHCESITWWSFRSSMHRWGNKKDMAVSFGFCDLHFSSVTVSNVSVPFFLQGDDPPYLSVGTEVSAKYKGAFCEAKIRKVVKTVKCKVSNFLMTFTIWPKWFWI